MLESVGFAKKLVRVQRQAALAITGMLRGMATNVLDVHANLLPIALEINKISQRVAIRYAMLPKMHPLHKVTRRSKKYVRWLRTPMHELRISPERTETIQIAWRPAEWQRGFEVEVAASKEEVLESENVRHRRW